MKLFFTSRRSPVVEVQVWRLSCHQLFKVTRSLILLEGTRLKLDELDWPTCTRTCTATENGRLTSIRLKVFQTVSESEGRSNRPWKGAKLILQPIKGWSDLNLNVWGQETRPSLWSCQNIPALCQTASCSSWLEAAIKSSRSQLQNHFTALIHTAAKTGQIQKYELKNLTFQSLVSVHVCGGPHTDHDCSLGWGLAKG